MPAAMTSLASSSTQAPGAKKDSVKRSQVQRCEVAENGSRVLLFPAGSLASLCPLRKLLGSVKFGQTTYTVVRVAYYARDLPCPPGSVRALCTLWVSVLITYQHTIFLSLGQLLLPSATIQAPAQNISSIFLECRKASSALFVFRRNCLPRIAENVQAFPSWQKLKTAEHGRRKPNFRTILRRV